MSLKYFKMFASLKIKYLPLAVNKKAKTFYIKKCLNKRYTDLQ